jgi:FkbM family methyltransferase
MQRRLLKWFQRTLRQAGVDVTRYDPLRAVESRRQRLLETLGIDTVLDVGANVGQFAQTLRAHGYKHRMVSFEPLSNAFAQLSAQARLDHDWECIQTAIGDQEGEVEINVAQNSFSSSILPMCDAHLASAPDSVYQRRERVPLHRLDSYESKWKTAACHLFLKIDVQGFERQVFEGARRTLAQARALEVELSLVPLYQDQPLALEIVEFLSRAGFRLVSLEPGFADPVTGQLLQVDGIFSIGLGMKAGDAIERMQILRATQKRPKAGEELKK